MRRCRWKCFFWCLSPQQNNQLLLLKQQKLNCCRGDKLNSSREPHILGRSCSGRPPSRQAVSWLPLGTVCTLVLVLCPPHLPQG